jgi:basic membrane lipoprotein Med (substrate-binding protein (PBP1-ABC) superfamily)
MRIRATSRTMVSIVVVLILAACAGPAATTAPPVATTPAAGTTPPAATTAAPSPTDGASPTGEASPTPEPPDLQNVEGLVFTTVEAAMLAGYASASWSKTKTMGTFGGQNIGGPVTDFMDGFVAGANYWNAQKGDTVRVLGWDPVAKTGSFTGNFTSTDDAKNLTITMLDEDADVLLGVGGPIGQGIFAAIRERSATAVGIGVDVDWTLTVPQYADLMLTHILKRIDNAVYASIQRTLTESGTPPAEFKACQVSDTGGTDDKSFNQNAYEGMQRAATELGLEETKFLESETADDFARNISQFLDEGCDIIVTVGFLLGDATQAAAIANPTRRFAIVDFAYPRSKVFVNTLANGGVGLGEFHDYDDEITADTKTELAALQAAIIDGSVVPSAYFAPAP